MISGRSFRGMGVSCRGTGGVTTASMSFISIRYLLGVGQARNHLKLSGSRTVLVRTRAERYPYRILIRFPVLGSNPLRFPILVSNLFRILLLDSNPLSRIQTKLTEAVGHFAGFWVTGQIRSIRTQSDFSSDFRWKQLLPFPSAIVVGTVP